MRRLTPGCGVSELRRYAPFLTKNCRPSAQLLQIQVGAGSVPYAQHDNCVASHLLRRRPAVLSVVEMGRRCPIRGRWTADSQE